MSPCVNRRAGGAGRTVADYTGGTPTASTDQTTAYTYDGDGHVTSMTAVLPSGQPSQTTEYVYGATTAAGSAVDDDDLLAQTQYPDPITGAAEAGTGWAFSGYAGVSGNGNGFTANNPSAPQGSQVAFLQETGSASQSVALAGGTYTLSFDAARRGYGGTEAMEVLVDGTVVGGGPFTPASTSYGAEAVTFPVAAGVHTITLQGVDPSGADATNFVDAVALTNASGGVAPELNDGGFETPSAGGGYTYDPAAGPTGQAESYAYDALGEQTGYTDRNGTTHAYAYDALGRRTADAVTHFGTGVDTAVGSLGYAYTDAGLLASATTYGTVNGAGPAPALNQDADAYDGFGQLASEEQAVSGSASTASPTVRYAYDAANDDRLTGMTYPNGRTLTYSYTPAGYTGTTPALTSVASQITSIGDSAGAIQSYTYLGMDTPVTFADGNGITLSYLAGSGGAGGTGGDEVTGLDQFGRVADQDWVNSSGTAVDEEQYTYDADSNVLTRDDTVVPGQSEAYQYDTLNRLTQFTRGTPGGTAATPTATWTLDALGNWRSSTADGVETDRTNTAQNQVATVQAAGSPTPTPLGYDADGNTLADGTGQQYAYDAWNRLVTVKNAGGTTLAAFTYDAQGRRVTEAEGGTTTALYYSKGWQVLEADQSGTATQQYVWSPFYVDGLVERDDHTPAEAGTALDRRLYAEQDADYNVTSLTNSSGSVVERYVYDPYGAVTVENPDGSVRGDGSAMSSQYSWVYLRQGLRLDVTTATYYARKRVYDVELDRWLQADPANYVNGANRYQFEDSNPVDTTDSSGLAVNPKPLPGAKMNPFPPKFAELKDLEGRKDFDYLQHGGSPGPDSAYLWAKIQALKAMLDSTLGDTQYGYEHSLNCGAWAFNPALLRSPSLA